MKTKVIRCSNSTVTDFYLDIIDEACKSVESDTGITITARYKDCLKAKLRGEKTILWSQGIAPEEYAMRHNNPLKLFAVDCMAKMAVKRADFLFFVSDYMREHYEKKYHLSFDTDRYYVMPCFNTEIHKEAFFAPGKYETNVFTYIGSMEAWQGVDHIFKAYKAIEALGLPDTSLEIFTSEQESAEEKLKRAGITNYRISFCPNEELPQVLKHVKYGFILREDNEVNRVSTPTKISTYMSCGVIPIYSECLRSFHSVAEKLEYVVSESRLFDRLILFQMVTPEQVYMEYEQVFQRYYSPQFHKDRIKHALQHIFEGAD